MTTANELTGRRMFDTPDLPEIVKEYKLRF
jgi:hypothetical protein